MAVSRCLNIGGPCVLNWQGSKIVTEGDVVLSWSITQRNRENALIGDMGPVRAGQEVTVRCTPISKPAYAPLLISLNTANLGEDVFGCSDDPLVIEGKDGKYVELKAAAVTGPPVLRFAPNQSLFGEVTFMAVVGNNLDLDAANAVYEITTGNAFVIPNDAMDPAVLVERAAQCVWESPPGFGALTPDESGIEVRVTYNLAPRETARNGVIGQRLTGIDVAVVLTPLNLTEEQILNSLAIQGESALIGNPPAIEAPLLVEHTPSAGGLTVDIANAFPRESSSLTWGRLNDRGGSLTFGRRISHTLGVLDPAYVLTVNP